jgi:hypothetical protein
MAPNILDDIAAVGNVLTTVLLISLAVLLPMAGIAVYCIQRSRKKRAKKYREMRRNDYIEDTERNPLI